MRSWLWRAEEFRNTVVFLYHRKLLSYDIKTLREDAQLAEKYIIALQYRSRARILQAKSFFINIYK